MLQEARGPRIASRGERQQCGEKGWERGLSTRSQRSRFQPRAPRCAASSGLPRLPAPPRPARPAPELGPERLVG